MLRGLQGNAADRAQACCRRPFLACYAPFHACLASRRLFTTNGLHCKLSAFVGTPVRNPVINILSKAWHGCQGLSMRQAGSCASGATDRALPAAA